MAAAPQAGGAVTEPGCGATLNVGGTITEDPNICGIATEVPLAGEQFMGSKTALQDEHRVTM